MNLAALLVELNMRLGDTDNFAFTSDEKTSVITECINDDAVINPVKDTSLTFTDTVFEYTIPATMNVVTEVAVNNSGSTNVPADAVSSDLWEVNGSTLRFKNNPSASILNGVTIELRGYYKYISSDTITQTAVQEFILTLAHYKCLRMYGVKKSFKFVKNDTSISEIVGMRRELERDVQRARARLQARGFESAG
jgi:hypothetical protein